MNTTEQEMADLKREAQEAQDRRAFVTRFRNGGPDEID